MAAKQRNSSAASKSQPAEPVLDAQAAKAEGLEPELDADASIPVEQVNSVRHIQALYPVVVGLVIYIVLAESELDAIIASLIDQQLKPGWDNLVFLISSYLITLIPFYHGNLRHLDVVYVEDNSFETYQGIAALIDFLVISFESVVLVILAITVTDSDATHRLYGFISTLILLLAVDAGWTAHAATLIPTKGADRFAKRIRQTRLTWCLINLAACGLLLTLAIGCSQFQSLLVGPLPAFFVFLICTTRSILDYAFARGIYWSRSPSGR